MAESSSPWMKGEPVKAVDKKLCSSNEVSNEDGPLRKNPNRRQGLCCSHKQHTRG